MKKAKAEPTTTTTKTTTMFSYQQEDSDVMKLNVCLHFVSNNLQSLYGVLYMMMLNASSLLIFMTFSPLHSRFFLLSPSMNSRHHHYDNAE
jgi:hypothetical protein